MIESVSINEEYISIQGDRVTIVALNEIKPNDMFFQIMNRYKPQRVMPVVEFIDDFGSWHILSLEDFMRGFKEL